MKRLISFATGTTLAVVLAAGGASANEAFRGPLGVLTNEAGVTDGYVLLTPQQSKTSYLVDNKGNNCQ